MICSSLKPFIQWTRLLAPKYAILTNIFLHTEDLIQTSVPPPCFACFWPHPLNMELQLNLKPTLDGLAGSWSLEYGLWFPLVSTGVAFNLGFSTPGGLAHSHSNPAVSGSPFLMLFSLSSSSHASATTDVAIGAKVRPWATMIWQLFWKLFWTNHNWMIFSVVGSAMCYFRQCIIFHTVSYYVII